MLPEGLRLTRLTATIAEEVLAMADGQAMVITGSSGSGVQQLSDNQQPISTVTKSNKSQYDYGITVIIIY